MYSVLAQEGLEAAAERSLGDAIDFAFDRLPIGLDRFVDRETRIFIKCKIDVVWDITRSLTADAARKKLLSYYAKWRGRSPTRFERWTITASIFILFHL